MKRLGASKSCKIIAAFLLFLLGTQILFSIPAPVSWLAAVWDAGDLISFVGTITLGIIAIGQTDHANKVNDRLMQITEHESAVNDHLMQIAEHESTINNRLMQLEENRYKLEIRPFIMIDDWSVSAKTIYELAYSQEKHSVFVGVGRGDGQCDQLCLCIRVTNTTQSYVSVEYNGITYAESNEKLNWELSYLNTTNQKLALSAGCSGNFTFWGKYDRVIDPVKCKKIKFSFILENRFGERYQEDIVSTILIMENPQGQMPYFRVHTLKYQIGKFVPTSDGKAELIWEEILDGQPQNAHPGPSGSQLPQAGGDVPERGDGNDHRLYDR